MGSIARYVQVGCIGFLTAVSLGVQAATSVLIWPIDPTLEADAKAGALWLENRGSAAASLQIRVFAWQQGEFQDQYQAQREVIGSPPVATLAPGQKQLVRLTRTGLTPPGQERAYRIIIDEIPAPQAPNAAGEGAQAAIRLQMRYSVPLFAYGEGLVGKPDADAARTAVGRPQLTWRPVTVQGKPYVEVRNSGPVHARLTDVTLRQGAQQRPLGEGLLGYVLPGASMRWPAPVAPGSGAALSGRINGQEQVQTLAPGS